MKPDTRTAMRNLIGQIRTAIPFDLPEAQMCSDSCDGCSIKLLEFAEYRLRIFYSLIHKRGKYVFQVHLLAILLYGGEALLELHESLKCHYFKCHRDQYLINVKEDIDG